MLQIVCVFCHILTTSIDTNCVDFSPFVMCVQAEKEEKKGPRELLFCTLRLMQHSAYTI
jgi:hypothetical protein